jgi:ATP-binding cassette subfamily B protein RaxB
MESVRTIGAIKRFCAESQRCNDWQNRFANAINARIKVSRLSLGLDLVQATASGIGNVAVIYEGARQVLEGQLTIGMLYAFIAYRNHMTGAVTSLGATLAKFLMLSLHIERLAEISETAAEEPDPRGNPPAIEGHLEIRDGAFRYSATDPWIFRHVHVTVAAHESLAIVGPSGCGKSTLIGAMMQLVSLEEGELRIDGLPASTIGIDGLRRNSASIMQSDSLLAGSIQSNITFGDTAPDFSRMHHVAEIACIHDNIVKMPMGYDSLVGEMGTSLSAGQVQRLLIARALYRRPMILFMDEGTAHLDKRAEMLLMRRLLSLNVTCIFTTHNPAVVPLADRVLVMRRAGCTVMRTTQAAAT